MRFVLTFIGVFYVIGLAAIVLFVLAAVLASHGPPPEPIYVPNGDAAVPDREVVMPAPAIEVPDGSLDTPKRYAQGREASSESTNDILVT